MTIVLSVSFTEEPCEAPTVAITQKSSTMTAADAKPKCQATLEVMVTVKVNASMEVHVDIEHAR